VNVQHLEGCPDLGPACASRSLPTYQHDQQVTPIDLSFDGELGLVPHLAVEVVAGLRAVHERIAYLDLQGAPYLPELPDTHHRNETLVGPTDPWLLLHAGTALGEFTLSAKGGLTLPLGSTVSNPFALGRQGIAHEHIQLGTGTFDPIVGASVGRGFGKVNVNLWTLDRFTLSANRHGYRSGHRLLFGARASSALGLPDWSFSLGADVSRETPERWDGVIEQEGNLGRTDLLLGASAHRTLTKNLGMTLGIKVPVASKMQGEQASYPALLTLSVDAAN
jgi:hypothetical protein